MTDKVHLVFPEQDLSIKGMFALLCYLIFCLIDTKSNDHSQ